MRLRAFWQQHEPATAIVTGHACALVATLTSCRHRRRHVELRRAGRIQRRSCPCGDGAARVCFGGIFVESCVLEDGCRRGVATNRHVQLIRMQVAHMQRQHQRCPHTAACAKLTSAIASRMTDRPVCKLVGERSGVDDTVQEFFGEESRLHLPLCLRLESDAPEGKDKGMRSQMNRVEESGGGWRRRGI